MDEASDTAFSWWVGRHFEQLEWLTLSNMSAMKWMKEIEISCSLSPVYIPKLDSPLRRAKPPEI